MPWTVNKRGAEWCVFKKDDAGKAIGNSLGCHASEKEAQDQVAALYAVSETNNEFRGMFSDVLVIRELRGNFPDVPFFDDVNIEDLTRGDDDPTYLTIPIGKINVKSGNDRFYGEAWVQELERQVRAKRPTGMMGHEDDDPMTFPPEAIFWVGARRIGELLWGKGYLPPGPPRDRVRRYKAANKTLGTSILAMADGAWDKARGAFNMLAETLDLLRIDIGPIEKLGIKDLGLVPILTSEMQDEQSESIEQEPTMADKLEVLQELRRAKVPPMRGWTPPANTADVTELAAIRELLEVDDDADLVGVIREMREQHIQERKNAVKSRITELIAESIALPSARGIVTELISARNPQTVQEAETAYQEVIASESVTELLKSQVRSVMGPRQGTPLQQQNGKNKYFVIPTDGKEEVR